jgi:acyl-CoA reductase-like NAD-dependent aldehyde dehydrogenase
MAHYEMLIAGHRIGGPCDQSVGKELVRNPADGSVVGTVAEGGWSELSTCLAAAEDAFQTWRHSTPSERAELLENIAMLVLERKSELAELAVLEIGKPLPIAMAELDRCVVTFKLSAKEARKLPLSYPEGETEDISYDRRSEGAKAFSRRIPRGVIFAITPYNWPFNLAAHKIGPALASGNTVVLKPSPLAAACTMQLALLVQEAGCPPGVLNCWNGPTPLVARALRDPRTSYLSFTGSAEVGWKLKSEYPQLPMTLELGGNAPAIICKSANLMEAVTRLVASAYSYAGQVCISAQNIFVAREVFDEFCRLWEEATLAFSPSMVGPMISKAAADKVEEWIEEGIQAKGSVLVGGQRVGNSVAPTAMVNVPELCRLLQDEVFGPVVTLTPFNTLGEVCSKLKKGKNAIHASIFTEDESEINQAIEVDYPGWIINDAPNLRFDSLPYGGERESGWGREGVPSAMNEFTTPQIIVIRNL